eukprot:COSAG06_NODE_5332_length_3542_cov_39.573337_3_plen_80_part_00
MCSICPLCSIFASGPLSDCPRALAVRVQFRRRPQLQLCAPRLTAAASAGSRNFPRCLRWPPPPPLHQRVTPRASKSSYR